MEIKTWKSSTYKSNYLGRVQNKRRKPNLRLSLWNSKFRILQDQQQLLKDIKKATASSASVRYMVSRK